MHRYVGRNQDYAARNTARDGPQQPAIDEVLHQRAHNGRGASGVRAEETTLIKT